MMHTSKQWFIAAASVAAITCAAGLASAEEASADVSLSTSDLGSGGGGGGEDGAFLAAGKVGGIASFNGLTPMVQGAVELGWVFGGGRNIGAMLQVEYTAPPADGKVTEEAFDPPRMEGGAYKWEIVQKELVFQPTFLYRLTGITDGIVPYAGIGPRIYLLESVVRGEAGGTKFKETYERSTKWGVGVPLGAEFTLGPGGVIAELLFQWGPLKHETTGDTHLGGGTLFVGYRALL